VWRESGKIPPYSAHFYTSRFDRGAQREGCRNSAAPQPNRARKIKLLNEFGPGTVYIDEAVTLRELTLEMADFRLDAENAGQSAELVRRARTGDVAAFEEIMRLHEKQVMSTALRMVGNLEDAQDIAQETFLRLYRNLRKLTDLRQTRVWLYRVTVNLCNDLLRKSGNRKTESLAENELSSEASDPESAVLESERGRLVEMALAALPAKERAAVVLRDIEGLSTREVAGILGSSEATVRSQISVARAKIKKFTDRHMRKRT
jgi:RNA polymerase sigma-70 factor, ECF subfamily